MSDELRDRAILALLKLLTRRPEPGTSGDGQCFLCPHCAGEGPMRWAVTHAPDCPAALLAAIEAENARTAPAAVLSVSDVLLRELRKVEWVEDVGDDEPVMRCPTCGELQDAGHAGDCSLALALAAARDAKEGT